MTVAPLRFSGELYVKRSSSPAQAGAENARQMVAAYAPKAATSLESVIPLIEKANADVQIEYFGQSGSGGALSECTVEVRPRGSVKPITIGYCERDDYEATRKLLGPGIQFNPFRLLDGRSPLNNEAPVWQRLRNTLQKFTVA